MRSTLTVVVWSISRWMSWAILRASSRAFPTLSSSTASSWLTMTVTPLQNLSSFNDFWFEAQRFRDQHGITLPQLPWFRRF